MWKHLPLEMHKDAQLAHLAAMAANEQGKFWEFHDKLFANQSKLQRNFLLQYARELELEMERFERSLTVLQAMPLIDADLAEAKSLGVTGTPGFFINGRFLSGNKPFDEFAKIIDAELTRLKLPLPPPPAKTSG